MRVTMISDEKALVSNVDEIVRLACEGQIVVEDFDPTREPIRNLLGPLIFSRIVLLSLEKTTYISSSGVSWLLICHKHFSQAKGRFILHSGPPVVAQVLDMLRMSMILTLARDEAEAIALARGGKT
jgi:anti-anti-sigma factor